ncbi:MAG: hypothetical protein AAF203_05920, partial [Pseudomonadota bacterium]
VKKTFPRRGWTEAFIGKRAEESLAAYADHTSIVTTSFRGKIVGGFRVIYSPYLVLMDPKGQEKVVPFPEKNPDQTDQYQWSDFPDQFLELPAEKEFGVNFPRKAFNPFMSTITIEGVQYQASLNFVTELSSLAVDSQLPPALRKHVLGTLVQGLTQMTYHDPYRFRHELEPENNRYLYSLRSQEANVSTPVIYTYGDAQGQRMYRPFGFESDPESEKEIDGRLWRLLRTNTPIVNEILSQKGQTDEDAFYSQYMLNGLRNVDYQYDRPIEPYSGQRDDFSLSFSIEKALNEVNGIEPRPRFLEQQLGIHWESE